MTKVIIAGGREFTGIAKHHNWVSHTIGLADDVEIVSGGARGADAFGEEYARGSDYPIKLFKAEWDKYGKSAGYRRNAEMANYADVLLAFWDGKSKGTGHMIDLAKSKNLKVFIYNYGERD